MKDDRIEVSFTEEEKKSFSHPKKEETYKPETVPPQKRDDKGSFQQKAVFSVLCLLFLAILFLCFRYEGEEEETAVPSAPPKQTLSRSINLKKGESAPITDENSNALNHILAGVGWDPSQTGLSIDVDSSVILMDNMGNYEEVCYYHLTGSNRSVIHHGDNLTGTDEEINLNSVYINDDENIDVYLDRVPDMINKLFFVINIYKAYEKWQSLNTISNMYINLYNPQTNTLLMTYQVTESTPGNALVLGVAEKTPQGWVFRAIGNTYNTADIKELATYCRTIQ